MNIPSQTVTLDKKDVDFFEAITADKFIGTANCTHHIANSGILTYLDMSITPSSQDHLGLKYVPISMYDEVTLSANSKFVQSSQVLIADCDTNVSWETRNGIIFRNHLKKLQKDIFELYESLGEESAWDTKNNTFSIKNEEDLMKAINISGLQIAKNSRRGNTNFMVIGEKIYKILLGMGVFLPTHSELDNLINYVGQFGSSYQVYLHLEKEDTLVMGKHTKTGESGVCYFFTGIEKSSMPDAMSAYSTKMFSNEALFAIGNYPRHNFFKPFLKW